jgi:hypothetical protein
MWKVNAVEEKRFRGEGTLYQELWSIPQSSHAKRK